jgi:hypothetical protein
MAWNPITDPCDYITLAQRKSPGLADIRGAGSPRKWNDSSPAGSSVYVGRALSHFSVVLRLYTEEDWADWHAWKGLVQKLPQHRGKGKSDSGAMDIGHPLLEELDIKAVVVEDVLVPEQTDDTVWTIEIKFLEFRETKQVFARPEAAKATPVDPIEDQVIKPLLDQWRSLANDGPPPLPVPP